MSWFKDDSILSTIALQPASPIPVAGGALARRLAETYNRIGGLMTAVALKAGIPVEAALAVWQAESGGLALRARQARPAPREP